MNKIRSIIVVLSVFTIIVGISSSCSDKEEKEIQREEGVSLENYVKKDYTGNTKLEFYDTLKEISQKDHGKGSEGPENFYAYAETGV